MSRLKKTPLKPSFSVPRDDSTNGSLEVTVIHTNRRATLKAVEAAARLSTDLAAAIRVLVLQIVPYPLSLDTPDVPLEFTETFFSEMASRANVDLSVDIRLGRDKVVMLESAIKPGSVIFIGTGRTWWPTAEGRVAKRLGCSVIQQF